MKASFSRTACRTMSPTTSGSIMPASIASRVSGSTCGSFGASRSMLALSVAAASASGRLRPESKIAVLTKPGQSTETPMSWSARSARMASDMPSTAYFVVL